MRYGRWEVCGRHREVQQAIKAKLFSESLENFRTAVELGPSYRTLCRWGGALADWGSKKIGSEADALLQEAIEKFQQAADIQPDHYEAFHLLGKTLAAQARGKQGSDRAHLLNLALDKLMAAERSAPSSMDYDVACVFALQGNEESCRDRLAMARKNAKLPSTQSMQNDVDLQDFRDRDWFKSFLKDQTDS